MVVKRLRRLKTFKIPDAVEGAVEVRLELAEALRSYGPRLRWMLLGLTTSILLVLAAMTIQGISIGQLALDVWTGDKVLSLTQVILLAIDLMLMIFVLALGATLILFLRQVHGFIALMSARYGTLEGEGGAEANGDRSGSQVGEDLKPMPNWDPAGTLLGLAREAEGEVSQVGGMLRYSTAFGFLLSGMIATELALVSLGLTPLADFWRWSTSAIIATALVLMMASITMHVESLRFFKYFLFRVEALEAYEDMPPALVPPGPTVLARYVQHLITTSGLVESGKAGPKELPGKSGRSHSFDITLGSAGDRVLIRVYPQVPGIAELREFRNAAKDVAQRDGVLPMRIVALVDSDLEDLDVDDVVYDLIMEHPLVDPDGERERSLQIVSEVEGHYSVLPFTHN
jgi:hypothetical protein